MRNRLAANIYATIRFRKFIFKHRKILKFMGYQELVKSVDFQISPGYIILVFIRMKLPGRKN